jgi:hypothetical protein
VAVRAVVDVSSVTSHGQHQGLGVESRRIEEDEQAAGDGAGAYLAHATVSPQTIG